MTSIVSKRTSYLFAMPSFASGFARGLDLFGNFDEYNTSENAAEADELAIANDWRAVGDDLREAYREAAAK
jgi:hypothetical protein